MNASYGWVPASDYIGEECILIHGSSRWWLRAGLTWWQVTNNSKQVRAGIADTLISAKLLAEQGYRVMARAS